MVDFWNSILNIELSIQQFAQQDKKFNVYLKAEQRTEIQAFRASQMFQTALPHTFLNSKLFKVTFIKQTVFSADSKNSNRRLAAIESFLRGSAPQTPQSHPGNFDFSKCSHFQKYGIVKL